MFDIATFKYQILGVPSDKIPLDGSVSYQDVEVLHVLSSEKEWKAMVSILTKIDKNEGISYIVSDQVGPPIDRKSTRLNSSHHAISRMPSSA